MSCCWRRLVKTAWITTTGSFRTSLSAPIVVVPSMESRRKNRSVTSPWEMSAASRSFGTGGKNGDGFSPSNGISPLASIGRLVPEVYARPRGLARHGLLRRFALLIPIAVMLWRAMPAAAADEAAKLYEAGRKAEHAGKMVQAFVLYSQAAQL